jgi:hypothetical protein
MLTKKRDEWAKLNFSGSSVAIFGARRPNHGNFIVKLDEEITTNSGHSTNHEIHSVLFNRSGLPDGPHTVEISNRGKDEFLDIDFVRISVAFLEHHSPSTRSQLNLN